MKHLEVSAAVRHIYIYIYIYVIRRLKVNTLSSCRIILTWVINNFSQFAYRSSFPTKPCYQRCYVIGNEVEAATTPQLLWRFNLRGLLHAGMLHTIKFCQARSQRNAIDTAAFWIYRLGRYQYKPIHYRIHCNMLQRTVFINKIRMLERIRATTNAEE